MKNIKLIFTTAIIATLSSCVTGDDYNTPDLTSECMEIEVTKEVSDITSLATADNPVQYFDPRDANGNITEVGVIEAYVTSSDEGGNFYKSISMVSTDGTIGFSIPVNAYNLYTKFEPGRKVQIKLDGLYYSYTTLTDSYELGNLYYDAQYDEFSVGRLTAVEYENKIVKSCTKVAEEEIMETNVSIADITADDSYLHKLIELEDVQFADDEVGTPYFDQNNTAGSTGTNHVLVDFEGNSIELRISAFTTFAAKKLPAGSGKVRGVLTKYNGGYQFMIRTLNDVKLTDERYIPTIFFEETFDTNFPNWTKYSVTGAQVWYQATFGNPAPCAVMSGFSGGNQTNEDWLISPAIDLSNSTFALLTFDNASRFSGNLLEAKISTNYSGSGNPTSATWTDLTATLDMNTGSYVWTSSGGINISSFTGNIIYIAFKYTSTTSASRTWEVDNIKVFGQ